jgi:GNAT superfamily N-acetyltransferase
VYFTESFNRFHTVKAAETYIHKLFSIANQQQWLPEELDEHIVLASAEDLTVIHDIEPFGLDQCINFKVKNDNGQEVASCSIISSPVDKKDGYLCNVFVNPEHRKYGWGTKLMNWITDNTLNKIKFPKFLKVGNYGSGTKLDNNQLVNFYSKFNFKPVEKDKYYNYGQNNQLVMELV